MDFRNSTQLDSTRLHALLLRYTVVWPHDPLRVRVRYSRGAEFSGTCYYQDARIYVNLGRNNRYPYALGTNLARCRTDRGGWSREIYSVRLRDAYQLVLFIYLHELYHYLIYRAGRCPRQKEGMCDRFAARVLVDDFAAPVTDGRGREVPRLAWDFQDLHRFVAAARLRPWRPPGPRNPQAVAGRERGRSTLGPKG